MAGETRCFKASVHYRGAVACFFAGGAALAGKRCARNYQTHNTL